ncbi:hypothetical protein P152DRAFT_228206 [Eremomyces bilateralis CBS 781.70]|uniref:Prion-inhibition and propagation HeLo domain-containing protein n=1 Tax=Eremomyces bilateralis CBS 781.70 TaxID=1392243 RepID=A0A6G1FR47_9PEZI|nr:uncharacterized protein P152DRAFT_228206 [Eremomyces bilateralis CBS 781.70]KAF1808247.1 hypothetical protein P152DRAFT_228206 [Eremomyces bilateralis CBS 781.70]
MLKILFLGLGMCVDSVLSVLQQRRFQTLGKDLARARDSDVSRKKIGLIRNTLKH